MKILHLVLYHDKEPYITMMQTTRPWYDQCEQLGMMETYYYCFDEKLDEGETRIRDDNLLCFGGKETYIPGILDKTILALQYFCPQNLCTDYDFIIRSNASSVINPFILLPSLERQQSAVKYGGTLFTDTPSILESNGLVDRKWLPLRFIHGTCLVLHKDAVELLLNNLAFLNRVTVDDVSIAVFFKEMVARGVVDAKLYEPKQVGYQYLGLSYLFNLNQVSVFRNNNFDPKGNRQSDVNDVQRQVSVLQTRFITIPEIVPTVKSVFYHHRDITQFVTVLCKENKVWRVSSQNNAHLDFLFGDPAPGKPKTIRVVFENGNEFCYNTSWEFTWNTFRNTLVAK